MKRRLSPETWDGLLGRRDLLRVGSLAVAGSLPVFQRTFQVAPAWAVFPAASVKYTPIKIVRREPPSFV